MRKKGVHYGVLHVLIMAVLVIIIMTVFMGGMNLFAKEQTPEDICRTSVAMKGKAILAGHELLAHEINCPTQIYDFTVVGNMFSKFFKKEINKEGVMLHLSREMYRCWYKFLEGEVDFHGDDSWREGNVVCNICSKTIFPEGTEAPTLSEFSSYLNTKKIPGKKDKFAEFFNKVEGSYINLFGEGVSGNTKMDLNKPVYTVFTTVKIDWDDIEDFRQAKTQIPDGVAFGTSINPADEPLHLGGQTEATAQSLAVGAAAIGVVKGIFIATGIAALSATGVGLIFLAVGGTAAYHFLSANMDAELPIYSIAVYSAEDIVGMCDYLM